MRFTGAPLVRRLGVALTASAVLASTACTAEDSLEAKRGAPAAALAVTEVQGVLELTEQRLAEAVAITEASAQEANGQEASEHDVSTNDAKTQGLSIDDPRSVWVVVNKRRPLDPLGYAPDDLVMPEGVDNVNGQPLRAEAAAAATRMVQAAQADGVWFRIGSAYRDFDRQEYLYTSYIARDGQAEADTYSARPGFSEHQTGLTADFDDGSDCYLWACFAETEAGAWLAKHSAEYGWILRYPSGAQHTTGYTFEPWHFRYVGVELATTLRDEGVATLEEYFGLEAAPGYLD